MMMMMITMTLLSTVLTISGLPKEDTRYGAFVKRSIVKLVCPKLQQCDHDEDCGDDLKCCSVGEFPAKVCLKPGNVFKYFQSIHHNQQSAIRALDLTS